MSKAKPVAPPNYVLDRREAVPALIGNHKDFLVIAGLAGTAKDMAALTSDGANFYGLAGAMGAAVSMGLGLALARWISLAFGEYVRMLVRPSKREPGDDIGSHRCTLPP